MFSHLRDQRAGLPIHCLLSVTGRGPFLGVLIPWSSDLAHTRAEEGLLASESTQA